ncbi:hypothetical protein FB446DRAFT_849791 [Lentinula raphanica]|nr:hypothetical protein FB446DRAFT_849791 [Lentinula raphanica]
MSGLPTSSHNAEFIFYHPPTSVDSAQESNVQDTVTNPHKSRRKTTSFVSTTPAIDSNTARRPVGRPRGSGYKQVAQKEIERQKRDNPAPYAAVGLTVPASSSSSSTWKEIMAQPANCADSLSNKPLLHTLSSVRYDSKLTSLSSTSATNPLSPDLCQQPNTVHPHANVLERAQEASSFVQVAEPSVLELPSVSNLAQSLSQLVDLDEDWILKNSVDSLMAEGIGENDLDADEDENDPDRDESEMDGDSPAGPTTDASSAQKKSPRRPYPTWFL